MSIQITLGSPVALWVFHIILSPKCSQRSPRKGRAPSPSVTSLQLLGGWPVSLSPYHLWTPALTSPPSYTFACYSLQTLAFSVLPEALLYVIPRVRRHVLPLCLHVLDIMSSVMSLGLPQEGNFPHHRTCWKFTFLHLDSILGTVCSNRCKGSGGLLLTSWYRVGI